jgi:hypothetical protein
MTRAANDSTKWTATIQPMDSLSTYDDDLQFRLEATDNQGNITRSEIIPIVVTPRAPVVYALNLLNAPNLGDTLKVSVGIIDIPAPGDTLTHRIRNQHIAYTLDYDDRVFTAPLVADETDPDGLLQIGYIPPQGSGITVHVRAWAVDNDDLTTEDYPANDEKTVEYTYPVVTHKAVLKVPPKPFKPYQGETLPIDFYGKKGDRAVVRIYSAEGKLVLTAENLNITADNGICRFEWNGRNRMRKLMPLGLYFCHLEVTDVETGKKRTDVAPIVIGDKLK